jgi:D-amino-acid dehydrogenase
MILDTEGCIKAEPALGLVKEKVAGGLRLPGDETGDCLKFTQNLARLATDLGVDFQYNTKISALNVEGDRIREVRTDKGSLTGDNYIVALGSYSPLLLKPLGIRVPIYPVKGYSATLPVIDEDAAPVSTMMDEKYKVAITRLGNRIRAAGTAELAGYDLTLRESRCETIFYVVKDLFPQGGDLNQVEYWTGLRPMTPDGTPVVGPTRYPNLFLNTGHGTLGWTMACGSGRVMADLITGRTPEISLEGLTVARYGQ